MSLWLNRNFNISSRVQGSALQTRLNFDKTTKKLNLTTNVRTTSITLTNSFNGKKVVLWLTENSNANVTKASISNYSATLTQTSTPVNSGRDKFQLSTEDGVFYRLMYSTNFYDFDSEENHKILIQEKKKERHL